MTGVGSNRGFGRGVGSAASGGCGGAGGAKSLCTLGAW